MESIDTLTGVVTNIPLSGVPFGEVSGSAYVGNGIFIVSDDVGDIVAVDITGFGWVNLVTMNDTYSAMVFPLSWITSSAIGNSICDNETVTLTNEVPAISYQWYNDGTIMSGEVSSTLVTNLAGDYHCEAINGLCSAMSDTISITINSAPIVDITPSGSASYCINDSLLLTGSSGGTSQWFKNGIAISGATSSVYYASTPGYYNMIKTDINGCADSASTGASISQNLLPFVSISPSPNAMICVGDSVEITSSSGSNYQWILNGSQIAGATMSSYFANTPGFYNVMVENSNGCVDSSSISLQVLHDSSCFVHVEENFEDDLFIYPNPTTDNIYVNYKSNERDALSIRIYSIEGKSISTLEFEYSDSFSIDLSSVNNGVYIIEITQGDNKSMKRFVKLN